MKLEIKQIAIYGMSVLTALAFSACNSDDQTGVTAYSVDLDNEFAFNADNYWVDCYNPSEGSFEAGPFEFSHAAWADVWDGVSYPAWNGFCPSKVNDNSDHSDDWVANQWACMAPNPMNGVFLVGNSESIVNDNPLDNDKCSISMTSHGYFNPLYAFVTTSSYAYYAAKNGTAFNQPFTSQDNFVLNVVGVKNGVMTGRLKFGLMAGGQFLTDWAFISLEQLGTVDQVLFFVDSTQKNSYGLTVPAYFCLTGFSYNLPSSPVK